MSNTEGAKVPSTKQTTMELAQYILSVLRTNPMVVFSWGFNTPIAINNGLRFRTQGFRHVGWVEVVYDEGWDLFKVRLIKGGKVIKEVEQVYVDMLIDLIDGLVERTDNYKEDVEQWMMDCSA